MPPTITLAFALLLQPAAAPPAGPEPTPTVGPRDLVLEGDRVRVVLPPGAIPALNAPELLDAAAASRVYRPDEPVLGVAIGGEAVAYSLWHLDRHEIVNHVVGGRPIAATW